MPVDIDFLIEFYCNYKKMSLADHHTLDKLRISVCSTAALYLELHENQAVT